MHEDHSGAADEAQAFATLLVVPTCLSAKENEKFSASAPQVQEKSVEAVQSLLQEGGFDVAEQRADARMPQRSTAMAAVTMAIKSDMEARQVSMRVCCGRCPSLRPVQSCWSFFGTVSLSSSGFSTMSRFGFTQNVHHVKKLELHAETGSIQVTRRHWEIFMTSNSAPMVQCGKNQDIHEKVENPGPTHCFLSGKEMEAGEKSVWPSLSW